jgi:short-subunit dehydrogenase
VAKSIFITGGTSGIGLASAREFKANGYRVGICGRNQEALSSLESEFETFRVDVTNLDQVYQAVEEFSKDGLDIIFANAGIGYEHKSRDPNFERARQIIDININGTLNTFESAMRHFYEKGSGHLVATASIAGLNGLPGVPAYSGSKSAIIKICESLRIDLKERNINVTCINPGFIDTPLTQKNNHSMPFLASSEDMAKAIVKGVENQKDTVYFPKLFSCAVLFLSILPRKLYSKIITRKSLNYSKK